MRVRESDEREGREGKGRGRVGGGRVVGVKVQLVGTGGGGGVRGVSSSTQKDSGKYDGVLEHSSTPPLIFLPSCSS